RAPRLLPLRLGERARGEVRRLRQCYLTPDSQPSTLNHPMLILPSLPIDCDYHLSPVFLPYQVKWIVDDSPLCLAEKSVRIGWTFADAFKNVRKRLLHPRRDYLFSSKDQTTAIEYVTTCYQFCQLYNRTRSILSHGIDTWKMPIFKNGKNTGFTEDF